MATAGAGADLSEDEQSQSLLGNKCGEDNECIVLQCGNDETLRVHIDGTKYSELLHPRNLPYTEDEDVVPIYTCWGENVEAYLMIADYLNYFAKEGREPADISGVVLRDGEIRSRNHLNENISEYEKQFLEELKEDSKVYLQTIFAANDIGVHDLLHLLLADFSLRTRNRLPIEICEEFGFPCEHVGQGYVQDNEFNTLVDRYVKWETTPPV